VLEEHRVRRVQVAEPLGASPYVVSVAMASHDDAPEGIAFTAFSERA
jgi:hypothetical protein